MSFLCFSLRRGRARNTKKIICVFLGLAAPKASEALACERSSKQRVQARDQLCCLFCVSRCAEQARNAKLGMEELSLAAQVSGKSILPHLWCPRTLPLRPRSRCCTIQRTTISIQWKSVAESPHPSASGKQVFFLNPDLRVLASGPGL